MTKAQRILELYDGKRSTKEIAAIVGCRPEYVRVAARQRKGSGESEHDRRYRQSPQGRAKFKRHWEKSGRERMRAYMQDRYATDPEFRERELKRSTEWKRRNRDHVNAYNRQRRAKQKSMACLQAP